MMTDKIRNELNKEEPTDFHERLLQKLVELVTRSRNDMGTYYNDWDKQSDTYDAYREQDKDDRRAAADKDPQKMVVPLTTAQINSFIAACFLILYQRKRFYEYEPTGPEDFALREISEIILSHDLKANRFPIILFQLLLDIARFGVGILKHGWMEDFVYVLAPSETELGENKVKIGSEYVKVPCFQGNKITNISPYRFFPDTRLPISRFQEGEFCASEDELPLVRLKELEGFGMVAGIKHVEPLTQELLRRREQTRFYSIDTNEPNKTPDVVLVTEVQIKLVPNDFELSNGEKLGPETFPIQYLVQYANDQRIIRIEPAGNYHSQFNYDLAEFTPDQHKQISKSLSGMVEKLQEVIDWIINARISSVKRTLDNQLVVDPAGVDLKSVENRSRIIKLRRSVGRAGIDRYIKPLPIQDSTTNHMADAMQLSSLMELSTGVNDAAMGQAQRGRRSATEMRAVTQGAASRLILLIKLIWEQALAPMGKKLLINSRQNITPEQYQKIIGEDSEKLQKFSQYANNAISLIGNADFFVFDGTLPSEKAFLAQSIQELATVLIQSGLYAQMGIDITKMIEEIYELRGVTSLQRFKLTPEEQAQLLMQQQLTQQPVQNGNNSPQQQSGGSGA